MSLVGRGRELAALEVALAAAARGERTLVLLSGEPGIGKTRLLEELARCALASGFEVAWGRSAELGQTPAFWPWMQVLAALGEPWPALDPRADAAHRLARFAELARTLARHAPLAVLLDDLHVADLASLQLLDALASSLVGARVLFALAARDQAGPAELLRIQQGARRVPLARLDREASLALVAGRADAQRVYELSDGNPLFIHELVAAQGLRLPALSSVRALLQARLAALSGPARATLAAAAVLGREFDVRLLEHVLGAAPVLPPELVTMSGPDQHHFSHALIAETLVDELPAEQRAQLHLRAAHAYQALRPSELQSVAHHLLSAGRLANEAALEAAERAAERCLAQLAFEDAAALLERASTLPGAPRARLLCAQAEALQHAGRHAEAGALCDQAAQLARDDPALFARIALARGLEWRFGQTDPRLVAALREALRDAPRSLRPKLLARLAAAEQPARDPREPVERALAAIALADELAAPDRQQVLYVATAALVEYLEPERLEPILRDTLGGDRMIAVHTRLRLCFVALERVDRAGFDRALQAFRLEAEALGLPRWLRSVHLLDALLALLEGRFADAHEAGARAEALCAGDRTAQWLLAIHQFYRAAFAQQPIPPGLRRLGDDYPPGRAAIQAWLATLEGARERAQAALAELSGPLPLDPDLGMMVASAIAFAGSDARAAEAYAQLASRSGRIVLAQAVGFCVLDLYDRLLLSLAARMQDRAAVDLHGARALEVAERLGSPPWVARVCADWADALGHDPARAEALRARARGLAARLGMRALAERLQVPDTALEIVRAGGLWRVRGLGAEVHVKDSRGIEMLAKLVAAPGCELHALDLVGSVASDAGPLLDSRARDAYRDRLRALHSERELASERSDLAALARLDEEVEALAAELERAFGLGGRARAAGSHSERARSNVQRRISHAIAQVRAASEPLGAHLAAHVRTGLFCRYL